MYAQGITTFLNSMSQFVSLPILLTVLGALLFRRAPKYAPKVITAVHILCYGAFMLLKPCYPTSGEPIHYLYAIASCLSWSSALCGISIGSRASNHSSLLTREPLT